MNCPMFVEFWNSAPTTQFGVVWGLWFVVCGLWFVVCGLWFVLMMVTIRNQEEKKIDSYSHPKARGHNLAQTHKQTQTLAHTHTHTVHIHRHTHVSIDRSLMMVSRNKRKEIMVVD
jgi:hypothetical protein